MVAGHINKMTHIAMILIVARKGISMFHLLFIKEHHHLIMLSMHTWKIVPQCHKMIHTLMNSTILHIVDGRIKTRKHLIVQTPLIKSHP
ncbi:hypothetical protein AHAS_Ahas11G0204600 [Arachis hypogaea]